MKLRLRSIDTNQTVKIEVPNSSSLQHLKQALAQHVDSSSNSIHISLNRKEELLATSPEETLQDLGLISGDLLFFSVNSYLFTSQTRPVMKKLQDPPQVLIVDTKNLENIKDETVNLITQKGNCSSFDTDERSVDLGTQNTVDSETLKNFSTQNEKNVDLVDTQMGESGEFMEVDENGPNFDAGKSFSVPGFLRKVFGEELGNDGGDHHKLLVIAVHAVLLESGFVCYNPVTNLVIKGFDFPEKWPASAFMMSLLYTLPEIMNHDCVKVDGVMTVVLKFQSMGKFFKVYGSLSMGSGTHCVCVNEDQVVPFLNMIWANIGSVSETSGKDGVLSTNPAREVFAFWRTVKDRLALPLLIDLCVKAGLDLPPCFMRLPTELMLQIFTCLPGVDVAMVGCVCSELRYLTSSDDLWKQKFEKQFGSAEPSVRGAHWKDKFAKTFEMRKKRRIAVNTSLMMDRHPSPGQFHVPPPGQFPGIIGGDYDILPPSIFRPVLLPNRGNPRFRNLLSNCDLGGLG